MTKERRLAAQMWEEISEKILNGEINDIEQLVKYKESFCAEYGFSYWADCYLCEYYMFCLSCPLSKAYGGGCGSSPQNPYYILHEESSRYAYAKEYFAHEAKKIASIIKGGKETI